MQINSIEIEQVKATNLTIPSVYAGHTAGTAFCIPKISPLVPNCFKDVVKAPARKIAKLLVESGVINYKLLPDDTSTLQQLVEVGMQDWLRKHVPKLDVLALSMQLWLPEDYKTYIADQNTCAQDPLDEERPDTESFGLCIYSGGYFNPYVMEPQVARLQRVPGLLRSALHAIKTASTITVDIRMPDDYLCEFQSYWESWGEIPTDLEAKEPLSERFDDDEETMACYLPSVIIPMLGGEECLFNLSSATGTSKVLSQTRLRHLGIHDDPFIANVANQTLRLHKATSKATRKGAALPNLEGIAARTREPGCSLMFKHDQRIVDEIDAQVNYTMETGEATDLVGLDELPEDSIGLKQYFSRLSVALAVLREMDQLLSLIAIPHT